VLSPTSRTSSSGALPGDAAAAGETTAARLSRNRSLRQHHPGGSLSASHSPASPEMHPAGPHSHGPRHLSLSSHSRPAPQPSGAERDLWESNVASSNLASSSDGLQALLRDHPELVSSSLAAAAGSKWSGVQSRGTQSGAASGNTTPAAEEEDEGEELKRMSASTTLGPQNPNLGSAGELR
jgi:hypothetical protein